MGDRCSVATVLNGENTMDAMRDRARGTLLGLACGDALGRPVEFMSAERIRQRHGRVTDMLANGTHGKPAGTVTDDTDLALCIAESLADRKEFDGADVAERFAAWYDTDPYDIGRMTAEALAEFRRGADWTDAGRIVWERSPEGQNAGNGSIMRCAPYAIAYVDEEPDVLSDVSRRSSAITHYDPRCTWSCAILNLTLAGLIRGDDASLSEALAGVGDDAPNELLDAVRAVPDDIDPDRLQSTGYVVHTLQTALYDALTAETAEEAIVASVNRGDDADTVGAVCGAVAGARFGASALPDCWLDTIDVTEKLERLADQLLSH